MHASRKASRWAFTLIELLVVIAIIGLLAAIISPAVTKAKEKGSITFCSANLRSLGQVLNMYADDHDDFLPSVGSAGGAYPTWDTHLIRYLGDSDRVFTCPSDKFRVAGATATPRTYSANGGFSDPGSGKTADDFPFGPYDGTNATHRLGMLKTRTGRLILLGERPGGSDEGEASRGYVGDFAFSGMDERPGTIHEGGQGANYLFADMSVILFRTSDTQLSEEADYWYVE